MNYVGFKKSYPIKYYKTTSITASVITLNVVKLIKASLQ